MTHHRKPAPTRHRWEFVHPDEGPDTERCARCGLERTATDNNCTRFAYHRGGEELGHKVPGACHAG